MSLSKKFLLLSAFGTVAIFLIYSHSAYAWRNSASGALICETTVDVQANGLRCLEGITENILTAAISLVTIGMFVMLLIGGLRYITAGGDQKAMDSAKKTLTYAVVGMAFTLAAYFLLNVLGSTLGLPNLLRFELPVPTAT